MREQISDRRLGTFKDTTKLDMRKLVKLNGFLYKNLRRKTDNSIYLTCY